MGDAEAGAQVHPLLLARLPDAVMDQLVGHLRREGVPVIPRDHRQHHVQAAVPPAQVNRFRSI